MIESTLFSGVLLLLTLIRELTVESTNSSKFTYCLCLLFVKLLTWPRANYLAASKFSVLAFDSVGCQFIFRSRTKRLLTVNRNKDCNVPHPGGGCA